MNRTNKRRELITKLKKEGKTWKEVLEITKFSKSVVSYYFNDTTKEKTLKKTRAKRKGESILYNKYNLPVFLLGKMRSFKTGRRRGKRVTSSLLSDITPNNFYEKFGRYTTCYLTGTPVDLFKTNTYCMDHIIPYSKGGSNQLNNLAIAIPEANFAKGNLSLQEFFELCKKVISHNKQ